MLKIPPLLAEMLKVAVRVMMSEVAVTVMTKLKEAKLLLLRAADCCALSELFEWVILLSSSVDGPS